MREIHYNVQLLVSSFFGTWAFFMFRSPFPELQIRVERLGKDYRLFDRVESIEVRLTMTPVNFRIQQRRELSSSFPSDVSGFSLKWLPHGFCTRTGQQDDNRYHN